MTKAEQARIMAWRLRILQWAEGEPGQLAELCRTTRTAAVAELLPRALRAARCGMNVNSHPTGE